MSDIMPLDKRGCFLGPVDPEAYHAAKSRYTVSKSMLKEFDDSPARYKYMLDRGMKKTSSGFRFGNLVDIMAFTPDAFDSVYHIVSDKALGETKAAAVQKAEMTAAGESKLISRAEHDAAREATDNLNRHMAEEWGLVLGKTFDAQMAWACKLAPIEGVRLLATGMIDIMPREGSGLEDWLFDGKTVGNNLEADLLLQRQFEEFKYTGQAGMYMDGVNMVLNRAQIKHFAFLCVESKPPYRVRSVVCNEDDLRVGSDWWQAATGRYAWCLANDNWPGLILPRMTGITPDWKLRALAAEEALDAEDISEITN